MKETEYVTGAPDKRQALRIVASNWRKFQDLSPSLRADPDVAGLALGFSGRAMQWVDEKLLQSHAFYDILCQLITEKGLSLSDIPLTCRYRYEDNEAPLHLGTPILEPNLGLNV